MNEDTVYFGIDVSKDVIDDTDSWGIYHQFGNNYKGFKQFRKTINSKNHCVMEATGYYDYKIAYYLQEEVQSVGRESIVSQAIHSDEIIKNKDR